MIYHCPATSMSKTRAEHWTGWDLINYTPYFILQGSYGAPFMSFLEQNDSNIYIYIYNVWFTMSNNFLLASEVIFQWFSWVKWSWWKIIERLHLKWPRNHSSWEAIHHFIFLHVILCFKLPNPIKTSLDFSFPQCWKGNFILTWYQGPLLQTWFNFNPNMDKQLHLLLSMGSDNRCIPKLQ